MAHFEPFYLAQINRNHWHKSNRNNQPADYILLEHNYNRLKQKAIAGLTPRCRLVFEMSRNEGKSYSEISQELGISENTVKNQISTALADIRTFLEKNGDIVFLLLLYSTTFNYFYKPDILSLLQTMVTSQ